MTLVSRSVSRSIHTWPQSRGFSSRIGNSVTLYWMGRMKRVNLPDTNSGTNSKMKLDKSMAPMCTAIGRRLGRVSRGTDTSSRDFSVNLLTPNEVSPGCFDFNFKCLPASVDLVLPRLHWQSNRMRRLASNSLTRVGHRQLYDEANLRANNRLGWIGFKILEMNLW